VASGYALARDGRRIGHADARAVAAAAEEGDPDAIAVLATAGRALGRAMATWSALLWPGRIAVAGGVARAGELLLGPARNELHRVGTPYIVRDIEVVPAELGADATLIGACHLAREAAGRSPDQSDDRSADTR
jgi:glucokinase